MAASADAVAVLAPHLTPRQQRPTSTPGSAQVCVIIRQPLWVQVLHPCVKFDGKTCVDTYLAKFESCAEYNNWTAKDKAAHLKSALTGNAANLLQGNMRATHAEVVGLL